MQSLNAWSYARSYVRGSWFVPRVVHRLTSAPPLLSTTLLRLVRLIEQEVRSQLLVLVAGEVSLDDQVTLETETA